jgi:hypothetical protein
MFLGASEESVPSNGNRLLNYVTLKARFALLFLWVIAICWLSLDSSPPVPDLGFLGEDKALHAFAYCTLSILSGWAFVPLVRLSRRVWLTIGAAAVLLGVLLEAGQAVFTTSRSAEFTDIFADAVGVLISFLIVKVWKRTLLTETRN